MATKHFEINETIEKLSQAIRLVDSQKTDKTIERIKLSDVTSSIAFWYEKIRNTVDYKEEHLLAKNAVERILKRLFFIEGKRKGIGEFLVHELIRGRYLSNDTIPVTKIKEVDDIVDKFFLLFRKIESKYTKKGKHEEINDWLISLTAFEIEKNLISMEKEETLVECMYNTIREDIVVSQEVINERDVIVQIYISIFRSLFKTDRAMLSYYLLKAYYPEWFSGEWQGAVDDIADGAESIKMKIEHDIDNPIGERLLKFCKKRAVAFIIIFDLMKEQPEKFIKTVRESQIIFEKEIKTATLSRYEKAKDKLGRSIKRSILYIFITKIILAFIIEVPYEQKIVGSINFTTLGVNVLFPPVLMFLIGSSIKIPLERNTAQIIKEANYAVYKSKKSDRPPYIAKILFPKNNFRMKVFTLAYFVTFLISFGLLIFGLNTLGFNEVSGLLFIFFLTLVSFFGIKIRQAIKDYIVVEEEEGVFGFLFDLFSLPIVRAGRWISERFSQVNIFVFVLDLIIEAPFKLFVRIFEDWIKFLKEKKEEIY